MLVFQIPFKSHALWISPNMKNWFEYFTMFPDVTTANKSIAYFHRSVPTHWSLKGTEPKTEED